jgi:hypothetical protein
VGNLSAHLQALRQRLRIPLAIPILLLGLLVLILVGRLGIGGGSTPTPLTSTSGTTMQPPLAQVQVPNMEGRPLAEAQQRFAALGLPTSAHDTDPTTPGSVVVSQEPPAGTLVPRGSAVGLRTALVTPALCAALADIPDTDVALFPALTSPRQLASLDAAAQVAPSEL